MSTEIARTKLQLPSLTTLRSWPKPKQFLAIDGIPQEKYWSFPNTDGTLEKILKAFEGEKVRIDSALQHQKPVIARAESPKQSQCEDLRRELLSRKYSYKTVKLKIEDIDSKRMLGE